MYNKRRRRRASAAASAAAAPTVQTTVSTTRDLKKKGRKKSSSSNPVAEIESQQQQDQIDKGLENKDQVQAEEAQNTIIDSPDNKMSLAVQQQQHVGETLQNPSQSSASIINELIDHSNNIISSTTSIINNTTNLTATNKAVGAKRRKPTQISKIIETPPQPKKFKNKHNANSGSNNSTLNGRLTPASDDDDDNEDEFDDDDEDSEEGEEENKGQDVEMRESHLEEDDNKQHNNRKEQALPIVDGNNKNRNGMIQSIVTELKSAKVMSSVNTNINNNIKVEPNLTSSLSSPTTSATSSTTLDETKQNKNHKNKKLMMNHKQEQDEDDDNDDDCNNDQEEEEEEDCKGINNDEEEGNDHANNLVKIDDEGASAPTEEAEVEGGVRLRKRIARSCTIDTTYNNTHYNIKNLHHNVVQRKGRPKKIQQQTNIGKNKSSTTSNLKSNYNNNNNNANPARLGRKGAGAVPAGIGKVRSKSHDETLDNDDNEDGDNMDVDDAGNDSYSEDGIDMKQMKQGYVINNNNNGDELHSCTLCSYTCPDKSSLLRHMRKHSGERPFQCRLCSFGFTTKANCERHLKNRHGQIEKNQVRNLIECHLAITSSNDGGSCSSNDDHGIGSGGGAGRDVSGNGGNSTDENESIPIPLKTFKSSKHATMISSGPIQSQIINPSTYSNNTNNMADYKPPQLATHNNINNNVGGVGAHLNQQHPFYPSLAAAALFNQSPTAAEMMDYKKSPSFMLNNFNNIHPMFFSGLAPSVSGGLNNLTGLTIANAHSNNNSNSINNVNNIKRNIFLDTLSRGAFNPTSGGGYEQLGGAFSGRGINSNNNNNNNSQQQVQQAALSLITTSNNHHQNDSSEAAPLDLSMDAVDLTVKRGGPNNNNNKSSTSLLKTLPKPKPMYPIDSFAQNLITSPYVSKRDQTMVHPQLPLNNFSAHSNVQQAERGGDLNLNGLNHSPTISAPLPGNTSGGIQFPLFPFTSSSNLPSSTFPFGLRPPASGMDMEKYIGLSLAGAPINSNAPSQLKNQHVPFMHPSTTSPLASTTNIGSSDVITDQSFDGHHIRHHKESPTRLATSSTTATARPGSYKSSSSASPNPVSSSRHHGTGKRSDKRRGGDYQKPKQRRYRTERPFSCPHCPAKFTLRSNMERHGKHQHPNVWQRSPSNRVINRQKNLASSQRHASPLLLSSPTLVPTNKYSAMNGFDYTSNTNITKVPSLKRSASATSTNIINDAQIMNNSPSGINVRAVIAQQLKRKMSNSNITKLGGGGIKIENSGDVGSGGADDDNDDDVSGDEDGQMPYNNNNSGGLTTDLASVSSLLNRAKSSNFAQYFNEEGSESPMANVVRSRRGRPPRRNPNLNSSIEPESESEAEQQQHRAHDSNNGNRNKSCSSGGDEEEEDEDDIGDEEGDEEEEDGEDEVEENEVENNNKKYKINNGEKKKSAYSSAPHKISCPHCTRRFPWTSSLRRHLLTHTGQKPYQCTKCPLLFTTKSNCDRHLIRKHNGKRANNNVAASNNSNESNNNSNTVNNNKNKRGRRKGKRGNNNNKFSTVSRSLNNNNSGNGNNVMESQITTATEAEIDSQLVHDEGRSDDDVGENENKNNTIQNLEENVQKKHAKLVKSNIIDPNNSNNNVTPKTFNSSTSSSANSSNNSSPGDDVAFRCHLCDASSTERNVLLTHMEEDHKETFNLLLAKGALINSPLSSLSASSPQSEHSSETDLITTSTVGPGTAASTSAVATPPPDQKDVTHRKVMCVFCIRRFWSVEDLRRHIRSHSGERPFSCPYCSRRFTLKHSMLRHIKKHDNTSTSSNNNETATSSSTPISTASLTYNNNNNNKRLTNKQLNLDKISTSSSSISTSTPASSNFPTAKSNLIGKLLGINDESLVEELLNKSDAKGAAELLGLGGLNEETTIEAGDEKQQITTTTTTTSSVLIPSIVSSSTN